MVDFADKNKEAATGFTAAVKKVLAKIKEFFENLMFGHGSRTLEAGIVRKCGADVVDGLLSQYEKTFMAALEGNTARNTLGEFEQGGMRYSFAGENAKTADKTKLATAQQMLADGVDSEAVRRETGWYQGYDGKWRFEIDDSDIEIAFNGRLSRDPGIRRYAELVEKVYFLATATEAEQSELADLDKKIGKKSVTPDKLGDMIKHPALFEAYPQLADLDVYFAEGTNDASYHPGFKEIALPKRLKMDPKKFKKTLIHEIQHAVQDIESFASGSNVAMFNNTAERSAYDQYHSTAGEIEARDAANRAELTAEERKNTRPDIDRSDVVFADSDSVSHVAKSEYDAEKAGVHEQIRNSQNTLNEMEPVFSSEVPTYVGDKERAGTWAIEELKRFGFQADRQGFGKIYFDEKAIRDAMNYLDTDAEKVSIVALYKVLKRGVQIGEHGNHKMRGKHTVTFAAPVVLNGIRGNMAVVVNMRNNKYKVHRILMPDNSFFKFEETKKNAAQESQRGVPKGSLANATSATSNTSISQTEPIVNPSAQEISGSGYTGLHSDPKDDIDNRTFSYNELVAKGDLQGVVIGKARQVPLKADGSIDDDAIVKDVKSKCQTVTTKGGTTYFVSVPDIGRNVEISKDGIVHGFIKLKNKSSNALPTRSEINARAALEIPQILANSIEVNRSQRGNNLDVPYTHVMMGTVAMEDAQGKFGYYAVRSMILERKNQNPILVEANVIGKLYAVNAKKIGSPHVRGTPKGVALAYSKAYAYSIADFLQDVKGVFDDTFSLDVYNRLGVQRKASEFSQYLLHSDPEDDVKSDREILAGALMGVAQNEIERNALKVYQGYAKKLDEMNARLREVNAEIRSMMFQKGARDEAYTKRLDELKVEKEKLEKGIARWDSKLFSLEVAKSLQDKITRSKG